METLIDSGSEEPLTWRVHLLRRHPERLPALLLVLFIGVASVWLLFERPLPVLAALFLLLGAAAEYLLPTTYCITSWGITARSLTAQSALLWRDARRCLPDPAGLIVTSLPAASRLDRFRGVLLRYARAGEPGDRDAVLAAIAHFAPNLCVPPHAASQEPGYPADNAQHTSVSTGDRP